MAGVVAMAGCGVLDPALEDLKRRDVTKDGLVTLCEGLSLEACAATPGCRAIRSTGGEGTTRACLHDGDGGCLQAVDSFSCVPVTPPPCSYLGRQECAADPRCELVEAMCTMECRPDGNGGCLPCNAPFYCAPKPPPPNACADLPIDRCDADPRCDVASVYRCSGGGVSDVPGATTPTPSVPREYCVEEQVCVPHETNVCRDLPLGLCMTTPGCAIEIPPACKIACRPGDWCPPCANPQPRCVPMERPIPPPERCEQLPVELCESNPGCEVQEGPVCMIACEPGGPCPPCATPRKFCAPKNPPLPPPERCASLSRSECAADPRCELVEAMCTMECRPDGAGGCLPCNAPFMCLPKAPMPPPDCVTLTPAACGRVPGCEVRTETVCTWECSDDAASYCGPGACFPLEGCFPIQNPIPVHDGGVTPPSSGSTGSGDSTR